jgi:phenylpropionate dioxygenase-like ring-hydroxylating dioxygenase large terminal subunit
MCRSPKLASHSDVERPSGRGVLSECCGAAGKSLVCWRDGSGDVKVVDDACPHKLAPLSLGKVTKEGDLMCRYHGYCFNGEGECTRLPMAVTESR